MKQHSYLLKQTQTFFFVQRTSHTHVFEGVLSDNEQKTRLGEIKYLARITQFAQVEKPGLITYFFSLKLRNLGTRGLSISKLKA